MKIFDLHSHWPTRKGYVLRTEEQLAQQRRTWNSDPSYSTEEEMAAYLRSQGVRTILELTLSRLPLALVPAAELLLARLPDLLAAWSGDEPPLVRVRREGDEDTTTTTYRSEATSHG